MSLNSCTVCHTSAKDSRILDFEQRSNVAEKWAVADQQILNWHQKQSIQFYLNTKHRQSFYESNYQKSADFKDVQTELTTVYNYDNQSFEVTLGRYQPTFQDRTFKDYLFFPRFFYEKKINSKLIFAYGKSSLNYFDDYTFSLKSNSTLTLSNDVYGHESESIDLVYVDEKFKSRLSKTFYSYNYNQRLNDNQIFLDLCWVQSVGTWTLQSLVDLNSPKSLIGIQYQFLLNSSDLLIFRIEKIKNKNATTGIQSIVQPQFILLDKVQLYVRGSYLNPDIESTDPKVLGVQMGAQVYLWSQFLLEVAVEKNQNTYTKIIKEDQESIQGHLDLSLKL